ncbi:hypothetical protein JOS77_26435 [Chromobacterium haemolyticum]|nr:hypothetical protein JOS77_26435 [Chromobacterium haemolyticum]
MLCGLLIQALGWRAIFALAGLVGLLALGLAAYCMRESRDPQATGLDWPGALSFTLALSLLTYGALAAPERGWNSPLVIGLLLGSAAAFWLFVTLERRAARPDAGPEPVPLPALRWRPMPGRRAGLRLCGVAGAVAAASGGRGRR